MSNALLTFTIMSPILLAIFLANLAEQHKNLRTLQYIYLLLLNGIIAVIGIGSVSVGFLSKIPSSTAIPPNPFSAVDWTTAGMALLLGTIIAMVCLLPTIRRLAARVLKINPDSIVHTTALSLTATAISANLFQMSLYRWMLTPEGLNQLSSASDSIYIDALVFPLLVLSLAALLGVGWLSRRTWPDVIERLGLTLPTLRQLALAVGVTALLIAAAAGTDRLWTAIDPASQKEVGSIMSAMMRDVNGFSGAFAIGITASIGEELFFRGAYQKRMGILMAALLFASFHTQYFISMATLLIFVIGLVLGVLRQKTTLAVCILVHFLYNFTSVLLGS
ncbi:MAG TPA: CPBP family intramembrane glutamic endopeptidase [Anaerolineae bacterium]